MCTATIVRPTSESLRPEGTEPDGAWLLRIVFNRDEGRNRPEGLPPEIRTYQGVRCIMPIDPVSDGTWIAVNEYGLAFFLLNHYPIDRQRIEVSGKTDDGVIRPSRGVLIPELSHAGTLDEVRSIMETIPVDSFAGFRLIAADADGTTEVLHRSDDPRIEVRNESSFPKLYVSSGLGDELVEGPRRALFDETFASAGDPIAHQRAFQCHSWPDAPHASVCMRRAEACTVSQTIVDISATKATRATRVRMAYRPGPPDQTEGREQSVVVLPCRR